MAETFPAGRISWHELMTTDPDAAIPFYRAVVGWDVVPFEHDPSYRMWTVGGTPVGGLMRIPADVEAQGVPPSWTMYVAVPDVDATVRQATALGAVVHVGPEDVPGGIRFAVLADPQGAAFALYRHAGDEVGHDGPPQPGEFSWHELATTDRGAAWDFYHALFGWEKTDAMDMGPLGLYQMFGRKGATLGGMYTKPPEMTFPPHWLCYAMVPNADAAAETVRKLGGQVLNGPMEVPGGDRIAQCMDPQGGAFAVHSTPQPVSAVPARRKPTAKPKATTKKPNKTAAPKRGAKAGKRPSRPEAKRRGTRSKKSVKKAAPKKATRRAR